MKTTRATLRQKIGLGVGLLIAASGWSTAPVGAVAVTGNINPAAIQIDKNANLYPGDADANILNPGARADWVKDSAPNNDGSDLTDSIATGIIEPVDLNRSHNIIGSPIILNPLQTVGIVPITIGAR